MDIKVTVAGDLMCSLPQLRASMKNGKYDFSSVFKPIKSLLMQSDYVIGNLETPIAGETFGYTNSATCFNTPIEFPEAANSAGFDCLTISNNHCLDRGIDGLFSTIDNLSSRGIDFTGAYKNESDASEPFVKSINGVKLAILSFTYGTNSQWLNNKLPEDKRFCVDLFRGQDEYIMNARSPFSLAIAPIKEMAKIILPQKVREIIKPIVIEDCVQGFDASPLDEYYDDRLRDKIYKAKERADIVVMCMHSGGQFNSRIGEYTYNLAHRLVDYGCDFIIGAHPHCVLKYEMYHNGFIAYSLGNFCFTPNYGYCYKGVYSDYSVLINLYFNKLTRELNRKTITITKTVIKSKDSSVVYPISLLLSQVSNKQKSQLIEDSKAVLRRFNLNTIDVDFEQPEIEIS